MVHRLPPLHTGKPRHEHGVIRPIDGASLPFAVIEGEAPGPCLLVTAGIHGSEYTSIEAALRLSRRPARGLRGSILVLPVINMSALRQRAIYVAPEDGRNLNRMFPGRSDGSFTERLAHWLMTEVYPLADAYLDLHGGDLSEALAPFSLFPRDSEASRELAAVFGLPVAVAAGGEGYTINAASRLGKPSVLAEVGGNGVWAEDGVAQLLAGIDRVLAHLGMIHTRPAPAGPVRVMTMWVPTADEEGLWYPAKRLGEEVQAGETIGEIRTLFGDVIATVAAREAGSVLYTLSSLWVNKGEALLGVGTLLE
ncbi:MAG: succinylglutamate desuccinylase/aspartoacylase family protein [Rhodospirillales bacterium]|nr:succinylglutamate desuccinylase/aspartoacylase family protein [Rhodospirillales bacterium]